MAEPAHRLGDEEPIYDESGTAPSSPKPDLKALEGGGETTEPKAGHLKEAGSGQTESPASHVYRPDNVHELAKIKPSVRGVVNFAKTNRGKVIIGGAAASIITLVIIGFFALIPFKILHIMNNLQSHFFATSESAVTKETDVLFSNYLKKYVLPGITSCKGTVDKACTPRAVSGTGLVSRLYKGWSNARLENTLANKYGLEFQYKKGSGHYYLKTANTPGDGVDLGSATDSQGFIKSPEGLDDYLAKSNDPEFKKVSRAEIRQAVKDSLSGETKFKQVMYRFKIGRLLEEKYGIKRCIIACTLSDNFSEWKNQKRIAAKAMIAQRILEPRSQMLGVIIECLADKNCHPENISTDGICAVGEDCEAGGEDRSKVEKDVQSRLDALAAKYGSEDVLKLYNGLEEKGFTQFTIEQILAVFLDEEAAQSAGQAADKALPVIGWINLAAQIVGNVNSAPKKIQKLSYITNSATMVATFAMYRTYADEIKNGHVDSSIVGSFTDTLGPNLSGDGMGGTAEAEQTPLYSRLLGDGTNNGSSNYKCNDGNPVPAGQSTCSETQLNNTNSFAAAISKIKTLPGFDLISALASLWNNTVGGLISTVLNWLGSLLDFVIKPLGQTVGTVIDKVFGNILQDVFNYIIPPIVSDNMSGGRAFDVAAGGADVSGNDYAHHGLGGQQLSSSQVTAILDEQQQEYNSQHSHDSFFARMFDSNSNNSLVTKLAMATPTSMADIKISLSNLFTQPFKVFSALFSIGHVQAATASADPFGITQYGYPVNDTAFTTDPETYWSNNCSTDGTTIDPALPVNAAWHQLNSATGVTINPQTQMPENTTTDPCYLIQASVGSDGGFTDSSLLTQDDLAGQ